VTGAEVAGRVIEPVLDADNEDGEDIGEDGDVDIFPDERGVVLLDDG